MLHKYFMHLDLCLGDCTCVVPGQAASCVTRLSKSATDESFSEAYSLKFFIFLLYPNFNICGITKNEPSYFVVTIKCKNNMSTE